MVEPAWQAQKGEGEGEGEKHERGEREGRVPSPLCPTPSLFPFFPIAYPFRRLLRRLRW